MRRLLVMPLLCLGLAHSSATALAESLPVSITFELPRPESSEYHRPYVAVWIEQNNKAVRTLSVWQKEDDWLKDIRRWWRKAGRYGAAEVDGVTGATRAPGTYQLSWDGKDQNGAMVEGDYTILLEASRENAGRDLHKIRVTPGDKTTYHAAGKPEIGPVEISLGK